MTIASSDIFYVVAEPGTGKTFTGDYLDHVHNFVHVDGDMQLRNLHIPKYRDNFKGLMEACKSKNVPDEAWQPYMQEVVDQTLEAAKTSDKVVLTFASQQQKWRDFVMMKLEEGGANDPIMVYLEIDQDVKDEGLYHRAIRQLEACGTSLIDWMKSEGWEGECACEGQGQPSLEEFKLFCKQNDEKDDSGKCDGPPSYAIVVDVTSRDVTTMDATDQAFGLNRNHTTDLSYECIVKEVVAMDLKRDEDTPYSLEEWGEIEEELKDKTEAELKQIKKRRSSLMKVERKTLGLAKRLSSSSNISSSGDDGKLKKRLIMTGKVEENTLC